MNPLLGGGVARETNLESVSEIIQSRNGYGIDVLNRARAASPVHPISPSSVARIVVREVIEFPKRAV